MLTAAGMRSTGPSPQKQGQGGRPQGHGGARPGQGATAAGPWRSAMAGTMDRGARPGPPADLSADAESSRRFRRDRTGQQRARVAHARQYPRRQVLQQDPRQAARATAGAGRAATRRSRPGTRRAPVRTARTTAGRQASARRATWRPRPGVALCDDDAHGSGRGAGGPPGNRGPQAAGSRVAATDPRDRVAATDPTGQSWPWPGGPGRGKGRARQVAAMVPTDRAAATDRTGRREVRARSAVAAIAIGADRNSKRRRGTACRARSGRPTSTTTSAIASRGRRGARRRRATRRRARRVPATVDDDFGNRKAREPKHESNAGDEPPRAVRPVIVDDDIGNR